MNLKSIIPWNKEQRPLAQGDFGNPFDQLQRRMNGLFQDFGFGEGFAPQTDISETDKEVRISAELPGLDQKDLDVSVSGNMLTIKGEKKEEQEEDKGDYWHHERSYGSFERAVQLPPDLDTDMASANFKNGVLKVTIPKKPEAQSSRKKIKLSSR